MGSNRALRIVAVGALTAATAMPAAAFAAAGPGPGHATKAQIEHAERNAAVSRPNKAQIEHAESVNRTNPGATSDRPASRTQKSPVSAGTDAAAWQLALSAAVGASATGLLVVARRRVTGRSEPVAT